MRKQRNRKPLFLFLLSIAVLGNAALAQDHPYGDAYVTGSIGDARVLIPFLADDSSSGEICGNIFNGLTKLDKDLNVVGDLAESWEISEDKLVITFRLRAGVKWHDGYPLTAEDVKFTFKSIMDPKNGCPYTSNYQDITNIEILDNHTIRFTYEKPYAPALTKLGMGIVPKHVLAGRDIRASGFKRSPVGTGPYKFVKWKTDEYIILESNKEYFEHRPYIDKRVTRVIPNQAMQFIELLSGAIDAMGLNAYQYRHRTQTPRFRKDLTTYKYLSHGYVYLGYNMSDPLFADRRVRRALSYAINRQEIIDGVRLGLGEVCTGPFLKGTRYYNESVGGYPFDPEKARLMLARAGWRDTDKDGILDKNGEPFKFRIITNQGNKEREDIATIIQRQFASLGIKVDIQIIAWAAFIDQFIDKKNFQAVILGWSLPTDPDCYNVWHSESSKEGGLNFVSYKNEEVDRLIVAGRSTYDEEERRGIYHKIHELISEDAPYTFLYFPYATPAISKRFRGIEPAPAGIGHNFIDWHVPEAERRY